MLLPHGFSQSLVFCSSPRPLGGFNVLCPRKILMQAQAGNLGLMYRRLQILRTLSSSFSLPLNHIISHDMQQHTSLSKMTTECLSSKCSYSFYVSLNWNLLFAFCIFSINRKVLKVPVQFMWTNRTKSGLHVADEGHKQNIQHFRYIVCRSYKDGDWSQQYSWVKGHVLQGRINIATTTGIIYGQW